MQSNTPNSKQTNKQPQMYHIVVTTQTSECQFLHFDIDILSNIVNTVPEK